jgi:ubiquinone/menaquinone biosynthesis C-methylase UbiE
MTESKAAYRGRTKYTPTAARRYQVRKENKNRAEMRLIDRAFAGIPLESRVLDVPCGGGRVTVHLAKRGYRMSAGDLSDAMLEIARESTTKAGCSCEVARQDVERLSFSDRAFDAIISFRLFHHFPNREIRERVVKELCRVSKRWVALSYFSPASVTSVHRRLRAAMGGRKSEKHATPLSEVVGYFEQCGFRLVKDYAQLRLVHTLHLALFERKAA